MRNKLIILGVFSILFSTVFSFTYTKKIAKNNTVATLNNNNSINKTKENNLKKTKIYKEIGTMADFSESFDKIQDLVANSKIIVCGKVDDLNSYITDYRRIYTKMDLNIEKVLKGNINEKNLKIDLEGGRVTYSEYFEANKDMFKDKLSKEEFDKAIVDLETRGNEIVEEKWNKVDNVKIGEKILLFLEKGPVINEYIVLGSTYYGLFNYNDVKDDFERKVNESGINETRINETNEINKYNFFKLKLSSVDETCENYDSKKEVTIDELKKIVESTEDLSNQMEPYN